MVWQRESTSSGLLEELNYCEDRVRDAARAIRHCEFCTEGWSPVQNFVERCTCFIKWDREMDEWREAKAVYEKASKQKVEPTPDMLNFHKVTNEVSYSPEKRKAILEMASSLGNRFAENLLDHEEVRGEQCQ